MELLVYRTPVHGPDGRIVDIVEEVEVDGPIPERERFSRELLRAAALAGRGRLEFDEAAGRITIRARNVTLVYRVDEVDEAAGSMVADLVSSEVRAAAGGAAGAGVAGDG